MHGGKRIGAGRPSGRNKYGEATKPLRVPLSKINQIMAFLQDASWADGLPLYANKVSAGFPSPADDYLECKLDLNTHLIKHPAATFFVKVSGDSMKNAGIHSGDMLIVDRSIEPVHGRIVIVAIDGELTVKRLSKQGGRVQLLPENKNYKPIDIKDTHELVIWGVVTYVIHETK